MTPKTTKVQLYQIQFGTIAVLVLNGNEAWAIPNRTTYEVTFEMDARSLLGGKWYPSPDNGQTLIPIEEFRELEPQLCATAMEGEPTLFEEGCDISGTDTEGWLTAAGRYLRGE